MLAGNDDVVLRKNVLLFFQINNKYVTMLKTLVLLVIIEATMAALHQRRNPQSASPTVSYQRTSTADEKQITNKSEVYTRIFPRSAL